MQNWWENFADLSSVGTPMCHIALHHGLGGERRRGSEWTPVLGNLLPMSVPNIAGKKIRGSCDGEELKEDLQLWEAGEVHELIGRVLGQQHIQGSKLPQTKTKPQTEEHRGKHACASTAGGCISISKAMKHRKLWTAASISWSPGRGTNPTETERTQAARASWGGGRCKEARSAMRERGCSNTEAASVRRVTSALMSAPGRAGERQEHLDAVVAFASVRRGGECSELSGLPHGKTGARECPWARGASQEHLDAVVGQCWTEETHVQSSRLVHG